MNRSMPDQGAVLAGALDVSHARSQKLLQSWMSSRPFSSEGHDDNEEDDEDFGVVLGEGAGVGSKVVQAEDGGLESILGRGPQASSNKLLEQLLGKKAAEAHRKSQQAQQTKSKSITKQTGARQQFQDRQDESEDEEQGRAAAFTSRKSKKQKTPAAVQDEAVPALEDGDNRSDSGKDGAATPRPVKRKAGNSYLDELLAQKARKKSKKKAKSKHNGD